jgi:Protein of unknown function (DUF1569)
MMEEEIQHFFQRIDKLTTEHKALFGKMNAHQMVCHCTDQLRAAMGTKELFEFGKVDPNEIIALAKSGKTVPTPKGLGQVEGDGTKPTSWDNDIKLLKEHILDFFRLADDFNYAPHPYFGSMNKKSWTRLVIWHLNHHLAQFNA